MKAGGEDWWMPCMGIGVHKEITREVFAPEPLLSKVHIFVSNSLSASVQSCTLFFVDECVLGLKHLNHQHCSGLQETIQ